jgi:hypothetical protein
VVNEVYRVIVGKPGHPEHFPYIGCWQDALLIWPKWLRVARVATTSKCKRKKTKEPVLAKKPKKMPPTYVPLYLPLPPVPSSTPLPLTLDGEA